LLVLYVAAATGRWCGLLCAFVYYSAPLDEDDPIESV
jgi:hypothetical protein